MVKGRFGWIPKVNGGPLNQSKVKCFPIHKIIVPIKSYIRTPFFSVICNAPSEKPTSEG